LFCLSTPSPPSPLEFTMRPRLSLIPLVVQLSATLAFVPACKKKKDDGGGGGGDPGPGSVVVPGSVSSDYFLYAHLNAKEIRDSAIFTEIKQAFEKAGGMSEWEKIEGEFQKDIGVKPTEID